MISMQGSEGPSDAIPHVTDELREAVQAATTTRRIQGVIPMLASAMTQQHAQLMDKSWSDGLPANQNRVMCMFLLIVL